MLTKAAIVFTVCVVFSAGFSSADKCVICDSTNDANCALDPQHSAVRDCSQKSACYTRIVGGATIRGCFADLDEAVQTKCLNDTTGLECFYCENGGQVCNNEVFPTKRLRCHTCFEDNLKGTCYTGMDGNAPVCKTIGTDDLCFTRRTAKSIERGCMSDIKNTRKCENPSHCLICPGNGCNDKMGNDTEIPLAPSSATAWTSTMALLLVPALICLQSTL